jgi:hypothetical protein
MIDPVDSPTLNDRSDAFRMEYRISAFLPSSESDATTRKTSVPVGTSSLTDPE